MSQFYQPGKMSGNSAYNFDMPIDQYGSDLNFQNFPAQNQEQQPTFDGGANLYANNPYLNPSSATDNMMGGKPETSGGGEFEDEPPLLEELKNSASTPSPSSDLSQVCSSSNINNTRNTTTEESNNIKYNWYQTEKYIMVDVLIKNTKEEFTKIEINENDFKIKIIYPDSKIYNLNIELNSKINSNLSTFKFLSTKIELKLLKIIDVRWEYLEKQKIKLLKIEDKCIPTTPYKTNWDKVVKDIEDDKTEGEAALNELFQKIYVEGSDEVRKAMNKSFMESGGTVLSTNWNEVGNQKVDCKPPDGLEFKKWE